MRRTTRRLGGLLAATALVAVACTGGSGTDDAVRPGLGGPGSSIDLGDVELTSALVRYDTCEAYLADVRAEALARVTPWGLEGGGWYGGPWMVAEEAVDDSAGADAATEGAATPDAAAPPTDGREVSGTNVQEEGVDEPDIVKTDGTHLYAVVAGELQIVDISDPAGPVVRSSTPLAGGWGAELLLVDDRLLVTQTLSGGWDEPMPLDGGGASDDGRAAIGAMPVDPGPGGPVPWSSSRTSLALVDVSDPTAPRVERTWSSEGSYVSARMVDGVARVVIRSHPAERLPFVQPAGPNAEDAALAANRGVIESSTIDQWIPSFTLLDGDGTELNTQQVARCDRLYRPAEFSGFGVLAVVTVDVDAGLGDGSGVALGADGETVYASADRLYVATNRWADAPAEASDAADPAASSIAPWGPEGEQRTAIHQFAIDTEGPAEHLASGSVAGHLLDQFSMSEHDGVLRVATTDGSPWGGGGSESAVAVLEPQGERLVEVGRVDGLGLGERIYAVRFLGDRGFVVTFRQVDPLYALDLSVPTAPRLTGELKIPGFSSYLHPVAEHLLLGVGQDATDDGRVTGSQVSLFDVTDPAEPTRVAQLDLGADASSEVEFDHRAFLWWDGLAVLPLNRWSWDDRTGNEDYRTGAVGIDVDTGTRALAERGRITHIDQSAGIGGAGTLDPWGTEIRRSVVVDDVLLTLSERGLLASDLATLEPVGWTTLG